MKAFFLKVSTIPDKLLDVIIGMIGGLQIQVSTAKGALVLLVLLALVADIILKGSVGFFGEIIKQSRGLFATLPKDGWFLVSVVLFVFLLKKKG